MVEPSTVVFGAFLGLGGVALVAKAETVALLEERWDAIGSVRSDSVEPTPWRVHSHRALGVVLTLIGLLFTFVGFVR